MLFSRDSINVRLFDSDRQQVVTKLWPLEGLEFAEDLAYAILEELGVGPVYRTLFGLKLTNQSLWLAPNDVLEQLHCRQGNKSSDEPLLELRMRYRPSSVAKLVALDKRASELIFAQTRNDFMQTKFNNEKRDFVMLNDYVQSLIATDLLRYATENDIALSELFSRVDLKDFIPRKAARWQIPLRYHLHDKLLKLMQIGRKNWKADVHQIKQTFVELFFNHVCPDYGIETYAALLVSNSGITTPIEIRIRYRQTKEDSVCSIETKPSHTHDNSKSFDNWTQLCDIYEICYGTLRNKVVELNRTNGKPFRVMFESNSHARSFVSALDGYFRLMKKWHLNFCSDIFSPHLKNLKKIKSHGPIGYETMRLKLSNSKKPGTFLIRKCMKKNNRFMIDVLLFSGIRLAIDIDWDPVKKVYTKADYEINRTINLTILLDLKEYPDLRALINDTQIRIDMNANNPPLQLKHWLPPSEYDDCPALLLSISNKRLSELELNRESCISKPYIDLPKIIPLELIRFSDEQPRESNNQMIVRFACLGDEQKVVVKELKEIDKKESVLSCCSLNNHCRDKVFDLSCRGRAQSNLKPAQVRIADWIFVKHPLFAESIGLEFSRRSLVQECLNLGSLDKYLARTKEEVDETFRRSVCFQLTDALLFLQENRIIHGKLRCHNIFLKSLKPLQIKISDPLGTFDFEKDRAFLPPEYFGFEFHACIEEYDSGIDVWAFGTTLWQIYSHGSMPPPKRYANTLIQPPNCPDDFWALVETCWIIEPDNRATPQSIRRELSNLSVPEKIKHDYELVLNVNSVSRQDFVQQHEDLKNSPIVQRKSFCNDKNHSVSDGSSYGCDSRTKLVLPAMGSSTPSPNSSAQRKYQPCSQAQASTKKMRWKNIIPFTESSKRESRKSETSLRGTNSGQAQALIDQESPTSSRPSETEATTITKLCESEVATGDFGFHVGHIDSDKLKLGPEIGSGSSGVVIKGVLMQWNGLGEQVVAVKCIDKEATDYHRVNDLRREFEILKSLDHENIVKTLGFVDEERVMLVVEYMPLGSLLSCLKNSRHDHLLSLPLKKYSYDIAKGMEYLASKKVVHRDLALRNILVKDQNQVKICDFGLAQFLGGNNNYKLKTDRALPLKWYAPEALNTWTFSHKTDVWSYGIVLWEIYSGGSNPQYSGAYATLPETLKHERLLMPKDCPTCVYGLMLACWAYNPDDRLNFTQVRVRIENYPD